MPDAADTEVVPYVTVPVTFSSISFEATDVADVTLTEVPENENQSFAGVPENASDNVTVTLETPS